MASTKWQVGQTVDVQSRTWAGINKPGGCAKITKVHYTEDGSNIEALDVKYVLGGGCEKEIDPAIISPYETLERGGRKRRGREFLMDRAQDVVKKVKRAIQSSGGSTTKNKKQESIPKCSKQTLGRQPKQRKTPAAKKTKERDHSTSPSTPVTPEHPSTHNRRKAKLLKLGEVPSYVIADGAVEVSPLPLDRAVVEQKKPTEARRGLFRSSPDVGEARPPTVVPGHPKSCATAKKTSTLASGLLPKPKTDKAIKPSAFSLYQSKPVGAKSTITGERKFGPRFMSNCPKPIKPFGKKEPLKRVFDYEVQKAREFLDEVYRAPCNDVSILGPSTKNTDFTPATSQPRDEKPKETSRREEFLSIFRAIRQKFDDEDGTMQASTFRALVAKKNTGKPFEPKEIDDHLQYLCDKGQLMQSDGVLYEL